MESLKMLSEIALSFQNLDHFEERMNEILAGIGDHLDVSRIYIFINESEDKASNIFEWCDEGIPSHKQYLQKVSNQKILFFEKILKEDGYIWLDDIHNLPQDIIDTLEGKGVKALVAYPLLVNQEMIGFIGLDECQYKREWDEKELEILKTISSLVSNAYQRSLYYY